MLGASLLLLSLTLGCGGGDEVTGSAVQPALDQAWAQLDGASLVLHEPELSDEVLMAQLSKAPLSESLRSVTISPSQVSAEGLQPLLAQLDLGALRWLNLSGSPVGDAGLALLAESLEPGLERLLLQDSQITQLEPLRSMPGAGALKLLSLGEQALAPGAGELLAELQGGPAELQLARAGIDAAGARALLARSSSRTLNLRGNDLGSGALQGLTELSGSISKLDLSETGVGLADLQLLATLPPPAELRELGLEGLSGLGDPALEALATIPWLDQLSTLKVRGTGAQAEARAALREAWGRRSGLDLEPR